MENHSIVLLRFHMNSIGIFFRKYFKGSIWNFFSNIFWNSFTNSKTFQNVFQKLSQKFLWKSSRDSSGEYYSQGSSQTSLRNWSRIIFGNSLYGPGRKTYWNCPRGSCWNCFGYCLRDFSRSYPRNCTKTTGKMNVNSFVPSNSTL